jgi:hypothetical protein
MIRIKDISQELLNRLFNSNVIPHVQLLRHESFPTAYTPEELEEIKAIGRNSSTVVGIDVYHYSQFAVEKQMFVPHLFDLVYDESWHLIKQNYAFIFQQYGRVIELEREKFLDQNKYFINVGDGGYQILETPLHGVIYILTFATILRLYNADRFMRKMHAKIGDLEVRYVMTFDDVYRYRDHFYGSGIINNSRILARDTLNRFIVDQNVYNWFMTNTVGIENLMSLSLSDIKDIEAFKDYDTSKITSGHNALIPPQGESKPDDGFKSIDVQKIGKVLQKSMELDIYNLHMQALIHYQNLFQQEQLFSVSIGNLNTHGIENR